MRFSADVQRKLLHLATATVAEVWFVDRPDAYADLLALATEALTSRPPLTGAKVFNVTTAALRRLPDERRLALRYFQFIPGVWLLMSDGTVQKGEA